jgi:alpha-ketoglutarate-dependent taurine dioxygenase
MSITITSYGSGLLVAGDAGTTLDTLTKPDVFRQLSQAGYVLFRNFNADMQAFSALVRKLSTRITLDPARSFGDASHVAQKVDAGHDAIGLHCENGNSPFAPELCWFYCAKAPSVRSQTTACDGVRVWNKLGNDTRRAFMEQDIVYSRTVEEAKWKRFVFHNLQEQKRLEDIGIDDVIALAGDAMHTRITPGANGSIHYAFRTAAAHSTMFGAQLAFANSILGPSYHYEAPVITFSDGTPLPVSTLAEIAEISESVTDEIDWHTGDVVLIDNTRVMHGRRLIEDPDREIYNALSYAN